jgi:hypothetical protein
VEDMERVHACIECDAPLKLSFEGQTIPLLYQLHVSCYLRTSVGGERLSVAQKRCFLSVKFQYFLTCDMAWPSKSTE